MLHFNLAELETIRKHIKSRIEDLHMKLTIFEYYGHGNGPIDAKTGKMIRVYDRYTAAEQAIEKGALETLVEKIEAGMKILEGVEVLAPEYADMVAVAMSRIQEHRAGVLDTLEARRLQPKLPFPRVPPQLPPKA